MITKELEAKKRIEKETVIKKRRSGIKRVKNPLYCQFVLNIIKL
jgi:hypothetical protein